MSFPLVDFDLPIYKFPTVEPIVEVLSLSFEKEALKLPKSKGTEPLSLLLLASGVQTPSTKQRRREVLSRVKVPSCVSGEPVFWTVLIGGSAKSTSWTVHSGWGWESRKGLFSQHVLASTKEEERMPLTPSTQICCANLQARPPNPYVQSVIWVLISHFWLNYESLRTEFVPVGRAQVGVMDVTNFSGE